MRAARSNVTDMFTTCLPSSVALRTPTEVGKVEQDYLRRIVLRELDRIVPQLISQTVRFALDHDLHVVLEGILATARYADVIKSLLADHRGAHFVFYLDVSLEETLRRHTTRPRVKQFTTDDMRRWYLPRDLLGIAGEHIIPETSTFDDTVAVISRAAGVQSDLAAVVID